jgi:hypothetical protein
VLVPRYGALGAALATALSLVLHNGLKQVGLRRCLGSALPPAAFRTAFVGIAVAVAVLAVVRAVAGHALVPSLLAVAGAGLLVAAAAFRPLGVGQLLRR